MAEYLARPQSYAIHSEVVGIQRGDEVITVGQSVILHGAVACSYGDGLARLQLWAQGHYDSRMKYSTLPHNTIGFCLFSALWDLQLQENAVVDCLLVLQVAAVGKLQWCAVAWIRGKCPSAISCTVLIRMSKEKSTALTRLESRI